MKTNQAILTRTQYLNGEASHHDYYSQIARAAGISFKRNPEFLRKVRAALKSGDEHLNTIPLQTWDNMCGMDLHNPNMNSALRDRGDSLSLSVGVCARKAIARAEALESPTI